jgi:hypothetical protein
MLSTLNNLKYNNPPYKGVDYMKGSVHYDKNGKRWLGAVSK